MNWEHTKYDGGPPMGWSDEYSAALSKDVCLRVFVSAIGHPIEWTLAAGRGGVLPLASGTALSVEDGMYAAIGEARRYLGACLASLPPMEDPDFERAFREASTK